MTSHALLDAASRYVVALRVADNEREETMLSLFSDALTMHGRPDTLYLDNGATYRGAVLATACARLGVSLLHARPYDPEARGKRERRSRNCGARFEARHSTTLVT